MNTSLSYDNELTGSSDSNHDASKPFSIPLVSDEELQDFKMAMYVIIMTIVSFFGVIFNIINIIVYSKMGLNDPVNITLMSLAVADACALFPFLWMGLCYNPLMIQRFPNLDFQGIQHLTSGMPHVYFSRVSSWLTALITFERFLCVALPLKVKTLVTKTRTVVCVVSIYVVIVAAYFPLYIGESLGPLKQAGTNRTVIGLVYAANGQELEDVNSTFNTTFQMTAFGLVVILTVGLVHKIRNKAKWRNAISSASKSETTASRDRKVVKMIICISVIYCVTYTPVIVGLVCVLLFSEYSITGSQVNVFLVSWMFFFLLEAINSSVNIFVYIKMSSKYKEKFMEIFKCTQKSSKQ